MSTLVLDVLGMLAVAAAIMVITSRSPVVAVMWLIAVFVMAACYLVCLGVTFVGLTYLVVYVGAVAVLFLFVVMMLNVRMSEVVTGGSEYAAGLPLGLAVATLFLYEVLTVAGIMPTYADGSVVNSSITGTRAGELALGLLNTAQGFLLNTPSATGFATDVNLAFVPGGAWHVGVTQVQALGVALYTTGALWLMLISLVLLLAMLGPIALCMRSPRA